MTYPGAASLVKRMREKKFATLDGTVEVNGSKANVYFFHTLPEDYLLGERSMRLQKPPKSGFYNNPFNLKGANNESR